MVSIKLWRLVTGAWTSTGVMGILPAEHHSAEAETAGCLPLPLPCPPHLHDSWETALHVHNITLWCSICALRAWQPQRDGKTRKLVTDRKIAPDACGL